MADTTETEVVVEGDDLEDALKAAAERLGTNRNGIDYRVVDSDAGGLFALFKKKRITIRAWRREADRPIREVPPGVREVVPAPDVPDGALEDADRFLREILTRMGIKAEVTGRKTAEGLTLTIEGDRDGLIIGRRGQTLDALQYIVNRYMQKDQSRKVRVILDCEGYRQRREQAIARMAQNIARKAKRSGKPVAAQPMDSSERRLFHLALKSDRGLRTESHGEGDKRKVVVYPVRKG